MAEPKRNQDSEIIAVTDVDPGADYSRQIQVVLIPSNKPSDGLTF